jgi:hypothetical protein
MNLEIFSFSFWLYSGTSIYPLSYSKALGAIYIPLYSSHLARRIEYTLDTILVSSNEILDVENIISPNLSKTHCLPKHDDISIVATSRKIIKLESLHGLCITFIFA